MNRAFYSNSIANFLYSTTDEILGILAKNNQFALEQTQRDAWLKEIEILKEILPSYKNNGSLYLEFSIPRMGQRIDAVVLIGSVIFILEFKVGEKDYTSYAIDQVMDYALDLKNFHETSHEQFIAPILIATKAKNTTAIIATTPQNDKLLSPIKSNVENLKDVIDNTLKFCEGVQIDSKQWEEGHYKPTQLLLKQQWRYTIIILLRIFQEVMLVPLILVKPQMKFLIS